MNVSVSEDARTNSGGRVIVNGQPSAVSLSTGPLVSWGDEGGLDLSGSRYNRRSRVSFDYIVVHWGGLDPDHCRRSLANVGYSSHFGVGRSREMGVAAYQWLDMQYVAYHAGTPANQRSVGIDICQSPQTKFLEKTRQRGNNIAVAPNPTNRGERDVLTLDSDVAALVREVVLALLPVLGIPARCPRGASGLDEEGPVFHGVLPSNALKNAGFRGVVGHHHIKKTKWDIACWWDQIFGGTVLG